jgi:hypothetical protein
MDNVQKHNICINYLTLKMVMCSSETSADFMQCYVPEDKEIFKL